jgi:hypothetical protein
VSQPFVRLPEEEGAEYLAVLDANIAGQDPVDPRMREEASWIRLLLGRIQDLKGAVSEQQR